MRVEANRALNSKPPPFNVGYLVIVAKLAGGVLVVSAVDVIKKKNLTLDGQSGSCCDFVSFLLFIFFLLVASREQEAPNEVSWCSQYKYFETPVVLQSARDTYYE